MQILLAVITGLLAGAHVATWGMYKDAPHEGFTWRKYSRSILLGGVIGLLLAVVAGLPSRTLSDLLVLFGVAYAIERAATEFYKTFLRNEDQSKYFIPMQFAVRGQVVRSRATRAAVGVAIAASAIVLFLSVSSMQSAVSQPRWWLFALGGSVGGWFSAFGGAWKDAPIEGFETFKFFRSPLLTATYAVLLSAITGELALAALAALGFTVATLETWKTFFFPNKPRGKFAGKPISFPSMVALRNRFLPLYAGIWVLIIGGFAQALLSGLARQ